jgi:hypothetical protein
MFQEVKSINAPLYRDPGPSSSQPPPAVPPSDHQKSARVPHAPTGAPPSLRFFSALRFVFLFVFNFFRGIEPELRARLELELSSSSIQTLSSRARAVKPGSTRARARARAWPNNKRAEPEQLRLGLGSARLHPYLYCIIVCIFHIRSQKSEDMQEDKDCQLI